jgi:hypothetical protein
VVVELERGVGGDIAAFGFREGALVAAAGTRVAIGLGVGAGGNGGGRECCRVGVSIWAVL